MLSRLFQQLFASVGVVFRTIRAFFARSLSGTVARAKSATSLTRQAAKLAPAMMKTVTSVGKKPTKREDYIETKQMFIAKSFLITVLIVVVSLAVLFYLVGWPWLVSKFFTAKMWYQDPDAEGYNGKVVLFYEAEKENIRFQGRLEEGIIQGKGSFFDESGLLVYTGGYVDGIYSGEGKLYADGALTYSGDFVEGAYNGEGKLYGPGETVLYEGGFSDGLYHGEGTLYGGDEVPLYEGSFSDGLYNGEGTLYSPTGKRLYTGEFADGQYNGEGKLYDGDGELSYQGSFSAGVRSGEGTAYEDGARRYKGTFENDLYDGTGTLYGEDGKPLYVGGFVAGLYDGDGVLSLGNGVTVEASFQEGEVLGDALCYANGKLYYQGGLQELLPEGTGTVYGSDDKPLYVGPMKNGAIDGGALLGLSADDIRTMLGDKAKETPYDRGFAITSSPLGLTVFCSFAQGEEGPSAYYVYLYEPGDKIPALLWQSAEEFEAAALTDEIPPEVGETALVGADFAADLPVKLENGGYRTPYIYEGYSLRLWSGEENAAPVLAEWRVDQRLPEPARDTGGAQGSAGRLDALLGQLGLLDGAQGSGGASAAAATENPYYGTEDVTKLLQAVAAEERSAALAAALTYFAHAEGRVAADENLVLCQSLLEEERTKLDLGQGDELRIAQLEDTLARLEVENMKHVVQMRKDARTVRQASGLEVESFDLQGLTKLFDVSALDAATLGEDAVVVAMEAALAAAKPPAEEGGLPIVEEVDREGILQQVEDGLLELELAYQDVTLAQREYETAVQNVSALEQEVAMGNVERGELLQAQMEANELRAGLYCVLTGFSVQAAQLNDLTGGKLAADVGWLSETLGH